MRASRLDCKWKHGRTCCPMTPLSQLDLHFLKNHQVLFASSLIVEVVALIKKGIKTSADFSQGPLSWPHDSHLASLRLVVFNAFLKILSRESRWGYRWVFSSPPTKPKQKKNPKPQLFDFREQTCEYKEHRASKPKKKRNYCLKKNH